MPELELTGAAYKFSREGETQRGFAMVLVIWILALLAVLAASVAADSHSEATIARNRFEIAQAKGLADAGAALAMIGLIDQIPATRWRADGSSRTIRYANGSVTITLFDEGGKIDLNSAPVELIGGLLDEFGVPGEERQATIAGIVERRRDFASLNPPTVTHQRALGHPDLPDTGGPDIESKPFADVSELRLVPGLTRAGYERVRPFLTVYSDGPTINPLTAPREALLAVPGISPQELGFFLAAREQSATSLEKPSLSGVDRYARVGDLRAATVAASARTQSGARFSRQFVMLVSPHLPISPFRIVTWGQSVESVASDQPSTPP